MTVGVQRFRDPEEARRALWTSSSDPNLARRIRALWARAARLAPTGGPRGVRKFKSIEDANADRDAWVAARVKALAGRRKPEGR